MSIFIIDRFELVEVEVQHRERLALGTGLCQGTIKLLAKEVPVGQRGQAVMQSQVPGAPFSRLTTDEIGARLHQRRLRIDYFPFELLAPAQFARQFHVQFIQCRQARQHVSPDSTLHVKHFRPGFGDKLLTSGKPEPCLDRVKQIIPIADGNVL